MADMKRFEPVAHTADKGIRAFGRNVEELFENAAFGMFSLMADVSKYSPTLEREIRIEAEDTSELLRSWLAELIYQFEVDRILFVDFEVRSIEDTRLDGNARGLPFGAEIEWIGSIVKAVTHHDLDVHRTDERWEATVILDV